MKVKTIGIDLAKDVFGMHGVNERGKTLIHRRVTRQELLGLLAKLEPCLVGMEACGSAHYWAPTGTPGATQSRAVCEALS